MNVEGMTRENVASHLQKYRLYLKRLAGYPSAARLPLDTLQQVQQACPLIKTSHVFEGRLLLMFGVWHICSWVSPQTLLAFTS